MRHQFDPATNHRVRCQNDGAQFNGASRIAIGFVPFVGPAMDICEAVTGKEWCIPSGRTLTTGERVFSGLGFGVGKVVKVWKGISSAAISTEGKAVASAIATLAPDLVEKLAKARIQKWKTLTRGSIGPTVVEELENNWEATSLLALIEKKNHKVLAYGKGSRDVLEIIKGADGNWPKQCGRCLSSLVERSLRSGRGVQCQKVAKRVRGYRERIFA